MEIKASIPYPDWCQRSRHCVSTRNWAILLSSRSAKQALTQTRAVCVRVFQPAISVRTQRAGESAFLHPNSRGCLFFDFPLDGPTSMETKFDPIDTPDRKPRIVGVVASRAGWEVVTGGEVSELDLCELRMDLLITEQIQPHEYLKPLRLPKILTIRDPRE